MFSGGDIRFEKGQRIAVATSDYFDLLGEVKEVRAEGEKTLVKVEWGRGAKTKEEWVSSHDLAKKLFDNRRQYWKLFEKEQTGWGEKRDVKIRENSPPVEFLPAKEIVRTLRETKQFLEKDLRDWRHFEKEKSANRLSTLARSVYYSATEGDFFHDGASLDLKELHDRKLWIEIIDRRIKLYEVAQKKGELPAFEDLLALELRFLNKAESNAGVLQAWGDLQSLYLNRHSEVLQSPFLKELNAMIARGVLETPLAAAVTSDDLEAIRKDINVYNAKGRGIIDVRKVDEEAARLLPIENGSKIFEKLHDVRSRVNEAVKNSREMSLPASARVGFALAKGALEMIDEPSLAIMLVAGAGIAGPLSRGLFARLVASGVPVARARLLTLAFNGMAFHTANSAINLGLDQLPGANRGAHADFTPEGNLHAIAMMWWLGKMQKLYGASAQGYLKFLRDNPALQKTLDTLGSKTFEIAGLASFNLGIGTAKHGLEALSADNIYAEIFESAKFAIAYGAMHAGQGKGAKSPGREALKIARKNFEAEVQKVTPDPKRLQQLTANAKNAFKAFQEEQEESLEQQIRLGKTDPGKVYKLLANQQRLLRAAIKEALRMKSEHPRFADQYDILMAQLNDQLEIIVALQTRFDPANRVIEAMERRAEGLKEGERPKRTFQTAAMRKKISTASRIRRPQRGEGEEIDWQFLDTGKTLKAGTTKIAEAGLRHAEAASTAQAGKANISLHMRGEEGALPVGRQGVEIFVGGRVGTVILDIAENGTITVVDLLLFSDKVIVDGEFVTKGEIEEGFRGWIEKYNHTHSAGREILQAIRALPDSSELKTLFRNQTPDQGIDIEGLRREDLPITLHAVFRSLFTAASMGDEEYIGFLREWWPHFEKARKAGLLDKIPDDLYEKAGKIAQGPTAAPPSAPSTARDSESGMAETRVPKWAERLGAKWVDAAGRVLEKANALAGRFSEYGAAPGPDSRIPEVKLFAKAGEKNQTLVVQGRQTITVGRSNQNTFMLEDAGISKEHFKLEYLYTSGGSKRVWVISDLGSRNGTKVNGRKIRRPTILQAGDKIEANGHVWIFGQEKSAGRGKKVPEGPVAEPAPTLAESKERKQEPLVQNQRDNPPEGEPVNPILAMKATAEAGESAATTDAGKGGEEKGVTGNQDAVLMVEDAYGRRHLVAFDGMGGEGREVTDGADASRAAMTAYAEEIKKSGDPLKAYESAHKAVIAFNRQKYKQDHGAGTAAVSVVVSSDIAQFHWAGDARGELYRPDERGKLRLVYRTFDDDVESRRVHDGQAPLNSDMFEKANAVSNHVGLVPKPKVAGEIRLTNNEMAVRKTEDGLVPDSESEPGVRIADEFKEGVKLKKGDKIILASDGVFFWEDIPELIEGLEFAEEIASAIRAEAHYRMELFREAWNQFRKAGFYEEGGRPRRVRITYAGKPKRLLEIQKKGPLYIDGEGNCYDSPTGDNKVAHFRMDHFSVAVYVHNPAETGTKRGLVNARKPVVPSDSEIASPTLKEGGELPTEHFVLRRERISGQLVYTLEDLSGGEILVNDSKLEKGVHYLVREGDVIVSGGKEIVFNPRLPILNEKQQKALQYLVTGGQGSKKSMKLEEALLKEDPIEVLKALADLPDMVTHQDWPGPVGRAAALFSPHRRQVFFKEILDDLFHLARERIAASSSGGEEELKRVMELRATANRAGWVEGESLVKAPAPGPSLSQRLNKFGCPKPYDIFDSLQYLLEHPRYVAAEEGKDRLAVRFDPEYENLIRELTSKLQTPSDMRQGLVNPQSLAVGGLLAKHGRNPDGSWTRFPKTKVFFEKHGLDWDPYRAEAQELLDWLAFPDSEWNQYKGDKKFDPVGKEGYADAVRELAEAVIPEFLKEPKIGMMGRMWFPFGKIEFKDPAGVAEREILRLLEGAKEKIEARLQRWREKEDEKEEVTGDHGADRGTEAFGYRAAIGGGRAAGTAAMQEAIKEAVKTGGGYWVRYEGKSFDQPTAKGRLYFAVRSLQAKEFWENFKREVLDPATKEGKPVQSKISNQEKRLDDSGDGAVLYFAKEDQKYFYEKVVAFVRRHEAKGWFHSPEAQTRPLFAAQVLDPSGNPVTGLSFGQDPGPHVSFNEKRAGAVVRALRQERLLDVLGVLGNLSESSRLKLRKGLIARELENSGVDAENPAFNQGIGTELFSFIHARTDQGIDRVGKTPSPPPAPPSPVEILKGRLAALRPALEEDVSTVVSPEWKEAQAEFARLARSGGERELTLAELDAIEETVGLEHLFELYSSRDPSKVVREVLTKEFADAMADYLLKLKAESGIEGRPFKFRETNAGDGRLILALQKRLADKGIEIADDPREADVILAERPYGRDKSDLALARWAEKYPGKTLILIGPESAALSPEFREQVLGRWIDLNHPHPKLSVNVQITKPRGLNAVVGADGELYLLSRSDHRAITSQETSDILVLRSSQGRPLPDLEPKKLTKHIPSPSLKRRVEAGSRRTVDSGSPEVLDWAVRWGAKLGGVLFERKADKSVEEMNLSDRKGLNRFGMERGHYKDLSEDLARFFKIFILTRCSFFKSHGIENPTVEEYLASPLREDPSLKQQWEEMDRALFERFFGHRQAELEKQIWKTQKKPDKWNAPGERALMTDLAEQKAVETKEFLNFLRLRTMRAYMDTGRPLPAAMFEDYRPSLERTFGKKVFLDEPPPVSFEAIAPALVALLRKDLKKMNGFRSVFVEKPEEMDEGLLLELLENPADAVTKHGDRFPVGVPNDQEEMIREIEQWRERNTRQVREGMKNLDRLRKAHPKAAPLFQGSITAPRGYVSVYRITKATRLEEIAAKGVRLHRGYYTTLGRLELERAFEKVRLEKDLPVSRSNTVFAVDGVHGFRDVEVMMPKSDVALEIKVDPQRAYVADAYIFEMAGDKTSETGRSEKIHAYWDTMITLEEYLKLPPSEKTWRFRKPEILLLDSVPAKHVRIVPHFRSFPND